MEYANTTCPYCSAALVPVPTARKKCPACGQPVYVRSGPDGLRYLLQEQDLPAMEQAWVEHRDRVAWLERARRFVDEAGFAAIEHDLAAKGPGYRPRDAYWAVANHAVLDMLRRNDWNAAQLAYDDMARVAYDEEDEDQESERVLMLKREANRAMLRSYLPLEVRRVEILPCSCGVCSAGPKKHLPIQDELREPRIPHAHCRLGWCGCCYVAETDWS